MQCECGCHSSHSKSPSPWPAEVNCTSHAAISPQSAQSCLGCEPRLRCLVFSPRHGAWNMPHAASSHTRRPDTHTDRARAEARRASSCALCLYIPLIAIAAVAAALLPSQSLMLLSCQSNGGDGGSVNPCVRCPSCAITLFQGCTGCYCVAAVTALHLLEVTIPTLIALPSAGMVTTLRLVTYYAPCSSGLPAPRAAVANRESLNLTYYERHTDLHCGFLSVVRTSA